jgi:hypothetical protein
VQWRTFDRDYPLEDDVSYIDPQPAGPYGVTHEATIRDADILRAFDRPTLIRAEWQRFFDHSEKTNEQHRLERVERERRRTEMPD